MDVLGVSGWVLLQIAIGVLVAVSWRYMRRRKRVKGGQPRLSVKTNACNGVFRNTPTCHCSS